MNNVEKISYFLLGAQCMFQVFAFYLMIKKKERTRAQKLYMWCQLYWVLIILKDYWFFSREAIPYQWAILLDLAAVPISSFFVLEQFFPTKVTNQFCLKTLLPIFVLLLISVPASVFAPYRGHNTNSDFWEYAFSDFQSTLVVIAGIYALIYAAFWTIKVLKQKHKYRQHLSENYSYTENINLEWTRGVIYALLGLLLFYAAIYFSNLNSKNSDVIYYIFSLIVWIYVYVKISHQEQLSVTPHYWMEEKEIDKNYLVGDNASPDFSTNQNNNHKKNNIAERIHSAFEAEKLHLNSKLTIIELASVCDTNRTYLSDFFNKELGCSFYDFVNRYRIEHVSIPMLKKDGNFYSMEEIAFASGFGSVSTFKRAFQEFTNIPPNSYFERYSKNN